MTITLKKYNLKGEQIGDVAVPETFMVSAANSQMIKDYIVAIRRNLRQWSANTKRRDEVNHSNQKPHAQKGTGKARQGSLASPQYKGGGVVFGPKPKFDQHVRINRKERRACVHQLLIEKIQNNQLMIIEDPVVESPKTKLFANWIDAAQIDRKALFVLEGNQRTFADEEFVFSFTESVDKYDAFKLSVRNLPNVRTALLPDLNAYDLLRSRYLVLSETAFEQLLQTQE